MDRFRRLKLLVLAIGFAMCWASCRGLVSGGVGEEPMMTGTNYQYELKAFVKVDGEIVRLPKPMYFTDFYMGAWNEYDLTRHPDLDLGTKLFYVPNQHPGPYYIGPYSSENFGNPETVRRRLKIIKNAGLYPAMHILSRHLINSDFERYEWNDYGAKVDGADMYSCDLFENLYRPILEELKLPYIIAYDMWGFDRFAPKDIPNETFNRLYWAEFEENIGRIRNGCAEDRPNDLHIRIREYTPDFSLDAYHPAIHLFGCGNSREKNMGSSLRLQILQAIGNPGATGRNPYTNNTADYGNFFWIYWTLFSPDVRSIPEVGDHGLWNIVNTDQVHADHFTSDFAAAQKMDNWLESVDNLGPRYFYGYITHLHNTPRGSVRSEKHNAFTGTDDERSFLTEQAREKGMVFTGIWNEYAESIIMEPANNVGNPPDEHSAWENDRPVFLDNFMAAKISVRQPPDLSLTPTEEDEAHR